MQILRNEVRTGLLVIVTLGLVVSVVLYISSPGLFRPLKKFRVYFDDAAGIKPGAAVMLAGRKIGTVADIQSPVPLNDRPEHNLNYEAMVRVQVAEDSQIYKETLVRMRTFGLLADLVIDFTNGNPDSGLAEPGAKFVGARAPDLAEIGPLVIQKLEPALKQSEATLAELQKTSHNLTVLTAPNASLTGAFKNFEGVGANLKTMTEKGGKIDAAVGGIQDVVSNAKDITLQLQKDNNLEKTIANFKDASLEVREVFGSLNRQLSSALPKLNIIVTDLSELTGRLKEQPWRIVWPSTIKYPTAARRRSETPQNR
ncbi:MAG: MCE family protein [Verrucomicrobia bacterium]|jgi:ABC-type transporter Mla subunit MlaD|nr:MCE family protein [Verrucomicrobiota bacterium]